MEPDPLIGCVLLRDLVLPDVELEPPGDFAKNVVSGKGYDLSAPAGAEVAGLLDQLLGQAAAESPAEHSLRQMFGDTRLVRPRLGQQAFRAVVLDAYSRRCAITGSHISPVLQAAHIRPVAHDGEHRVDNGMLLRSDVHTLFDRGLVGVDPDHRLHVSPRIRDTYGNGAELYARQGKPVHVPQEIAQRPGPEFLEWHMDEVFQR